MADEKLVTVLIGQYGTVEDALADMDYVLQDRELHLISTFDGAVVAKDEAGRVRIVRKHETPVRFGAWGGMVVGGIIGLAYPPILLELGAVGAATGAIVGHFWKGMSRTDINDLGDSLLADTAALVIAVDSDSADKVKGIMGRARSISEKQVAARTSDIDRAIEAEAQG